MALALGLSFHRGVVHGVLLDEAREDPTIIHLDRADLSQDVSLTPHLDHLGEPPAQAELAIQRTAEALAVSAGRSVRGLIDRAAEFGEAATVGIIVPRSVPETALAKTLSKRRFAQNADDRLVAEVVVREARRQSAPVVAMTAQDALAQSRLTFGLDRQGVGQRAKALRAELGEDFVYHHRLASLAAWVVLAGPNGRI